MAGGAGVGSGGGGGSGASSTKRGAAKRGMADHSSASATTTGGLRFQEMPQVNAATSKECAANANTMGPPQRRWSGGSRLSVAGVAAFMFAGRNQLVVCTDKPTRCTPARCRASMTLTTVSYFTVLSAPMTTGTESAPEPVSKMRALTC